MRHFYLIITLFVFSAGFCQVSDTEQIAESEMKSASGLMAFTTNANTQNYDITYHKLEFTVNPAVYFITGKVTTTYTALSNMSNITFDLTNQLNVTSVTKNGVSLTFTQNSQNELVINFPTAQASGTSGTVVINYNGQPASGEDSFVTTTHSGTPILTTLSEPFGARDWWPCKQDLNDKVDNIDVYITAPAQFVAVSNGLQVDSTVNGLNKTTHFHHGYPIPAYLIAIAVSNYQIFTQNAGTAPHEFPIVNYIYPEQANSSIAQLATTLPVMNLFEEKFGTYPFSNEKYGHAQWNVGGGMEHTTVSFMSGFNRSLVAHELGHQWFGDKVTCGSWKDIWLNEGFAEYLSGLVVEGLDGDDAFTDWKDYKISSVTSQTAGNLYLTDLQATNSGRIFSSRLTYNKGSMVANMLRYKLGDALFFQGIRQYLDDPNLAYKYAVTTDLKNHLEAVSGQDLTQFFDQWVYQQGYPSYNISAQNFGPGQIKINVSQTQSDPSVTFFQMPLTIRLYGTSGQTFDAVVDNTSNNQQFIIACPFTINGVLFDPKKNIISRNNNVTLGNTKFELDKAFAIYPNPTNSVLNIQAPDDVNIISTNVYNLLGQKILSGKGKSIDVSKLSTGTHVLEITTEQGTFHKKFIKQ